MATLPKKSSLHYNVEAIARNYNTYESVWVAVGHAKGNKLTLRSINSCGDER